MVYAHSSVRIRRNNNILLSMTPPPCRTPKLYTYFMYVRKTIYIPYIYMCVQYIHTNKYITCKHIYYSIIWIYLHTYTTHEMVVSLYLSLWRLMRIAWCRLENNSVTCLSSRITHRFSTFSASRDPLNKSKIDSNRFTIPL